MDTRLLALTLGASMLFSGAAFAQAGAKEGGKKSEPAPKAPAPKEDKTPAKPAEKPAMKPAEKAAEPTMEDYAKAAATNENHKLMEMLAGSWESKLKFRMAPEQPWGETSGTEYNQIWYDGRYLHTTYKGEFGGMDFKGLSIMGYNNATKQFESTWIDNMSTGIIMLTGSYDAKTKTFTFSGDAKDPVDGKVKKMKEIIKITGSDSRTSEFFETGKDGKEFKSMEVAYTRKAKDDDKGKDKEKASEGEKAKEKAADPKKSDKH